MKLFKFYPRAYSRMYVVAKDEENVRAMKGELFDTFMQSYCGHHYEDYYDADLLAAYLLEFETGLLEIEAHDLCMVDNHY